MPYTMKLTPERQGFRDVYWCTLSCEPVIVEYRERDGQRVRWCTDCSMPMESEDDGPDIDHLFLGHLEIART